MIGSVGKPRLPPILSHKLLVCDEPCGMPDAHSAQTKLVQKCPINYMRGVHNYLVAQHRWEHTSQISSCGWTPFLSENRTGFRLSIICPLSVDLIVVGTLRVPSVCCSPYLVYGTRSVRTTFKHIL